MSTNWTSNLYPYNGGVITTSQNLSGTNPGISFQGTETGGGTTGIVEINGGMWLLTNVVYNSITLQFSLVAPARVGTGLLVGATGALQMFQQPANSAPWTSWNTLVWSFASNGTLGLTDINTGGVPLTVEAASATVTVPNTASAGLFVQNSTTAFQPQIGVNQNIAGGGKWVIDTATNNLRFLNTPFGGSLFIPAILQSTGGAGNSAALQLSNGGFLPPVLTSAGAGLLSTTKIVTGQSVVPIANGAATGSLAVSLAGASLFTSTSSYQVLVTAQNIIGGWASSGYPIVAAGLASGGSFTIYAASSSGTASSAQSLVVSWMAIGY